MNCAPVAVPDTATTLEDSSVDIAVLANDSDPDGDTLTIDPASRSAQPRQRQRRRRQGALRAGRELLRAAPDTFTYRISDGNGHQATASVS